MKTLVVVAHSDLENSVVNSRWIKELEKYPQEFTIHKLYELKEFDIEAEQDLIKKHDKLVLQFPIYWFSSPPLMKKWIDDVFVDGWAYGKKKKMTNHRVSLLVTAGTKEKNYKADGRTHHTLKEILVPFEVTFNYMSASYEDFYAIYGVEHDLSIDKIEQSLPGMLEFLRS